MLPPHLLDLRTTTYNLGGMNTSDDGIQSKKVVGAEGATPDEEVFISKHLAIRFVRVNSASNVFYHLHQDFRMTATNFQFLFPFFNIPT